MWQVTKTKERRERDEPERTMDWVVIRRRGRCCTSCGVRCASRRDRLHGRVDVDENVLG